MNDQIGPDRRVSEVLQQRHAGRRFASREELLAAVYQARYDAVEQAIDTARLREAPVAVALHL